MIIVLVHQARDLVAEDCDGDGVQVVLLSSSNIACCRGDPCGRPVCAPRRPRAGDHKGRPYIILDITRLRNPSTVARQPGGIAVVASNCSTMAGPVRTAPGSSLSRW